MYPVTLPLQPSYNRYLVQTTIGGQEQSLLFNTGSSVTVITAVNCVDATQHACFTNSLSPPYDPQLSATAHSTGAAGSIVYLDGVEANGTIYTDVLLIANTSIIAQLNILAATSTYKYSGGVLGASHTGHSRNSSTVPYTSNMFHQWYADNQPYGAENTMLIDLCHSQVLLGADTDNGTNSDTVRVRHNAAQPGPALNMEAITIGDQTMYLNRTLYAALHTGGSNILVPSTVLQQIITTLQRNTAFRSVFPTVNDTFFYTSMSNAKAAALGPTPDILFDTLPSLALHIATNAGSTAPLVVHPYAYVALGYMAPKTGEWFYTFNIGTLPELDVLDEVVLGTAVLQQYLVAINRTSNDINLTPQPSACYIPLYVSSVSKTFTVPRHSILYIGLLVLFILPRRILLYRLVRAVCHWWQAPQYNAVSDVEMQPQGQPVIVEDVHGN